MFSPESDFGAYQRRIDPAKPRVSIWDLCRIGFGMGFTLWSYRTNHTLSQVQSPGYWPAPSDGLPKRGDVIYIITPAGVAIRYFTYEPHPEHPDRPMPGVELHLCRLID